MDIPNRDELEADLVKRIMRVFNMTRREITALLGIPPDFGKIPQSLWDKHYNELAQALTPAMTEIYMDATERLVSTLPVGVDWGLVNSRAANWARQYAGELIRGLVDTSRRAVQDKVGSIISDFFQTPGMTREQIEAQLRLIEADLGNGMVRIFGPVRSEMIAITEVTRAASEGEQEIMRELKEMGVEMVPIWQTRNDELVCPICGPKHDKEITDGVYPPAHPRCRCFTNLELPNP